MAELMALVFGSIVRGIKSNVSWSDMVNREQLCGRVRRVCCNDWCVWWELFDGFVWR